MRKDKHSLENREPTEIHTQDLTLLNTLLLKLTKLEALDEGRIDEAIQQITEVAAEGLGIDRSSVWIFDLQQETLVCLDLFDRKTNSHTSGTILNGRDFPSYFGALKEERTIAAEDACRHPFTREFAIDYLEPLNIFSMLDAPIRKQGKTVGVFCNESVGAVKNWSLIDKTFAGALADIVARLFISNEKAQAVDMLRRANENLESLVAERTQELEVERAANFQSAKMAGLGVMSAGIAHEINTPLATIQMVAGHLYEAADGDRALDHEFLRKQAQRIEATTERIAKIIRALRAFSRDVRLDPLQKVPVKHILTDTLLLCKERFYHSLVEIQVTEVSEDLQIECRPVQIQQILLNLLNNSFDAISREKSEKWVRIDVRNVRSNIEISVTDSGPGIPKEIRPRLMEPFFTTKPVGKGTGLGLSVSNGLARSNNGSLVLDDACKNTCFKLVMPAANAELRKQSA